jgi:hypothetical protein
VISHGIAPKQMLACWDATVVAAAAAAQQAAAAAQPEEAAHLRREPADGAGAAGGAGAVDSSSNSSFDPHAFALEGRHRWPEGPRMFNAPHRTPVWTDWIHVSADDITGRSKIVTKSTAVWWKRTRGETYDDNTGCEDLCHVVESKNDADLLVSLLSPEPKVRKDQHTVHFTRESVMYKDGGQHISQFDLTMDMSPLSNIPIVPMPADFWKTMHEMPIPTLSNLKTRKLAVWAASNCGGEWDRVGYLKELSQYMHIDFPGRCLHNTKDSLSRAKYTNNAQMYADYLFVFGFHNALDNANIDEKLFLPFQGNSVNVVMQHDIGYYFAPGNHSFVDASRFKSPKELAAYLLYLQDHLDEYLTYFDYRHNETKPTRVLDAIQNVSIYQKGNLCRLCACVSDPKCLQKRKVTQRGYENTASSQQA